MRDAIDAGRGVAGAPALVAQLEGIESASPAPREPALEPVAPSVIEPPSSEVAPAIVPSAPPQVATPVNPLEPPAAEAEPADSNEQQE